MRSRTLLIALVAIIALAAGIYLVGMPIFQKQQVQKLQEALNKLPGCSVASIEPKGFGQNFIINDLRLRFDIDEETFVESYTKQLEINGLNISAFNSAQTNLLFDEVIITGASNTLRTQEDGNPAAAVMAMNFGNLTLRGLKLNVPAFTAYIQNQDLEKAIYNTGFFLEYVSGNTFVVDFFDMYSGKTEFSLSIASHMAKNSSTLTSGYSEATGIIAKSYEIPVLTISKISCDASSAPDFTLVENLDNPAMLPATLEKIFKESPLKIENLIVSELSVPGQGKPGISIGNIKLDMNINEQTGTMTLAVANCNIPAGMDTDWQGQPIPPKDLVGDLLLDINSKREDRKFTIDVAPLSINLENLGEASYKQRISFVADSDIPEMWMFSLMGSGAVHSVELMLKDRGAREVIGLMMMQEAEQMENRPASTTEALAQAASNIRAEAEHENPTAQKALNTFADFIEKGGTFTMAVQPAQPIPTQMFLNVFESDPAKLNMSVTRTE